MFKVICMDDSNRPDGIPISSWIKKGNTYTVLEVAKMRMQGGVLGFKLEEINIDGCFPYQFFAAKRFGIPIVKQMWVDEYLAKLLKEAQEEFINNPILI